MVRYEDALVKRTLNTLLGVHAGRLFVYTQSKDPADTINQHIACHVTLESA